MALAQLALASCDRPRVEIVNNSGRLIGALLLQFLARSQSLETSLKTIERAEEEDLVGWQTAAAVQSLD